MVGELLNEIMDSIGETAFNFDLTETSARLSDFLAQEKYVVFMAQDEKNRPVGFIALYEAYALYAEGTFGVIPEFYVRPAQRGRNAGLCLLEQAMTFAKSKAWKRLEVTTPPLPQFDKTLAFYQRDGFAVTGGRKLKILL